MIVSEDIYLEHYGVPGMKWGVRREARRDVNKSKKLNRKTGTGSIKSKNQRAKINEKSNANPVYAKAAAKQKKKSLEEIQVQQVAKMSAAIYGAAFVGAYVSSSPGAKKAAVAMASTAGKAYRRVGESQVDKIIRKSAYVVREGSTIVDAYSRVAGETVRVAGQLAR